MPSIGDMSYGFDQSGIQEYLDEIKSIVLTQAVDAVEDISSIKSICEAEWEGRAREKFIENLQKDTKKVGEILNQLYIVLNAEINSVGSAMADKDKVLIQ